MYLAFCFHSVGILSMYTVKTSLCVSILQTHKHTRTYKNKQKNKTKNFKFNLCVVQTHTAHVCIVVFVCLLCKVDCDVVHLLAWLYNSSWCCVCCCCCRLSVLVVQFFFWVLLYRFISCIQRMYHKYTALHSHSLQLPIQSYFATNGRIDENIFTGYRIFSFVSLNRPATDVNLAYCIVSMTAAYNFQL